MISSSILSRQASFSLVQIDVRAGVIPALARNGFCVNMLNGFRTIKCFSCGIEIREPIVLNEVFALHEERSPRCPMVLRNEGTGSNIAGAAATPPQPAHYAASRPTQTSPSGPDARYHGLSTQPVGLEADDVLLTASYFGSTFGGDSRREHVLEPLCLIDSATASGFSGERAVMLINENRMLKNKVESQKEEWVCKVCLDHRYDVDFFPCGHLCCAECARRLTHCHICRTAIAIRHRIFP